MTATLPKSTELQLARRNQIHIDRTICLHGKPPRLRTLREFAEQELVLPDGPYKGERFRVERQPWTALAIDQMDRWSGPEVCATGPVQSGKTLIFFVLVIMYYVFEHRETVIVGIPDMDMAYDKWLIDIRPAILASRYRAEMPAVGGGSRGGKFELIQFTGGGAIKFMSGGGSDATRAGFTGRILVITEADKMAKAGPASMEANKIAQLKGRTRAYGRRARIYMECTPTIEQGVIWQGYSGGTASRIITPCPHCRSYVEFTRDHLHGWREADNELEAQRNARFVCPECAKALTEADRVWSNRRAVIVHRGQEISPEGVIRGEPAPTATLGFRWSGFHNLFVDAGLLGLAEWRGSRAVDADDAEKDLRQFNWCMPYQPPSVDLSALDLHGITRRTTRHARGVVPEWADVLTMGIDVGKYLLHYQVTAWGEGYRGHVVDYGVEEVASQQLGEENAVPLALRRIRDELVTPGWTGPNGPITPHQVWVDSGWQGRKEHPDFVYDFIRESNGPAPVRQHRWRPAKGFGFKQYAGGVYQAPLKAEGDVKHVGDHYHLQYVIREGRPNWVIHLSADHWKTFFHNRLSTPLGHGGALSLFAAPPHEHLGLARHYTAERKIEEYVAGRGSVVRWERVERSNHYLDAATLCAAAAHWCGIRLAAERNTPVAAWRSESKGGIAMPDGRPFLATRR